MIKQQLKANKQAELAKKRKDEYLTFVFFEAEEKGGLEFQVAGWKKLSQLPGRAGYVKGVIELREQEIEIIDMSIKYGRGSTELTEKTCILVFEYSEPYEHYLGIVVEDVSSAMNIAGEKAAEAVMSEIWELN